MSISKEEKLQKLFSGIIQAVEERNLARFRQKLYLLTGHCHQAIYNHQRELLPLLLKNIREIFHACGRTNVQKGRWEEAERLLGRLETFDFFIDDILSAEIPEELIATLKSKIDQEILLRLSEKKEGYYSSEIATLLHKNQNVITNRLPKLLRLELIHRMRQGKNSLLIITPRGREIVERLGQIDSTKRKVAQLPEDKKAPPVINGPIKPLEKIA